MLTVMLLCVLLLEKALQLHELLLHGNNNTYLHVIYIFVQRYEKKGKKN